MSTESLVCWKCGATLDEVPMPLSRLAECLSCRAELHVCRMCRFYDVSLAQDCSEPMADEVKEKGRANFCEYLEPDVDAFDPPAPSEMMPGSVTSCTRLAAMAASTALPPARPTSAPASAEICELDATATRVMATGGYRQTSWSPAPRPGSANARTD